MNRKLNIGVLGAGQISQAAHFDSVKRSKNAILYGICDTDTYLLDKMSERYEPIKAYTNYDEMLDDEKIDAIIIGVADQFHVPLSLKAINSGKHVLVEKPLGVSIEEVKILKDAVKESGLHFQIGNMKRFDQGIEAAHDFIKHKIGEIISLNAWYCDSTYRYTATDNTQPLILKGKNMTKPGGNPKANKESYYMLGHGSHLIDTAMYLGGEIVAVTAWLTKKYESYSWAIAAEFKDGFIGQLNLTIQVRMDWHEGFEVFGEFGSVLGKTYNPWYLKASDVEIFKSEDNSYHRPIAIDGHFYRRQVEDFASTILTGTPGRGATIDDGVLNMKVMKAIHESAKYKKRIVVNTVEGAL